jgi:hypothetical protein
MVVYAVSNTCLNSQQSWAYFDNSLTVSKQFQQKFWKAEQEDSSEKLSAVMNS